MYRLWPVLYAEGTHTTINLQIGDITKGYGFKVCKDPSLEINFKYFPPPAVGCPVCFISSVQSSLTHWPSVYTGARS